jgi:hypothetical protein
MRLFLLLILSGLLLTCSKKKDPAPAAVADHLTLSVNDNYPFPKLHAFITNSSGAVIASLSVHKGVNQIEIAPIPDVINLTILHYYVGTQPGEQSQYLFDTYPDVALNSIVTLVQSNGNDFHIPGETGKANFTVTNYSLPNFNIPSIAFADGYTFTFINTSPATASSDLMLHQNPADVLATTHATDNSHPVYAWFKNVHPSDHDTIAFADFQPFPHTIPLPFSGGVFASVSGFKQTSSGKAKYFLSFIDYQNGLSTNPVSQIGYLDGFDSYETIVNSTVSIGGSRSKTTTYFKLGAINPSITLPNYEMNIIDPAITAFQFTYSGNSVFQIHTWGYSISDVYVTWNVYSDGTGVAHFVGLPEDVLTQFPVLNFSKLAYMYSCFYHFPDDYSYHAYFEDMQKGKYPLTSPEYHKVFIQQY